MRVMTERAILGHRLVVPQERPALFSVTFETRVVDGCPVHRCPGWRSMRVVAIRADDLTLNDRVPGWLVHVIRLLDVALPTDFWLLCLVLHRVRAADV